MSVSRETSSMFDSYSSLLAKWNSTVNLVSPLTIADIKRRHISDCLQLTGIAGNVTGKWVDLGSGGGLPGLVVAIAYQNKPLDITLVESDQRKSIFLRTVVRELGLSRTSVLTARIETSQPQNAAYVSARALAPLSQLMAYLDRHMVSSGKAFLMKGQQWQAEVDEARKRWVFDCIAHPSQTQEGAAILEVSGVRHAG